MAINYRRRLPPPADRTAQVDQALAAAKSMSDADFAAARLKVCQSWINTPKHTRTKGAPTNLSMVQRFLQSRTSAKKGEAQGKCIAERQQTMRLA